MKRKLRMGMVGGGRGAFIGAVHRIAAHMDGQIELVCGCFSSNPDNSRKSAKDFYLPADRAYDSYQAMFKAEAKLPEGERMDFVSIVTPNHMHYPIAMAALNAGFHVVCDKPMTMTLSQAKTLERKVKSTKLLFALTHNYTGYPMVKEARDLVQSDKMGKVRRVNVEYPQGWLAGRLEKTGQKQADWRTDPKRAGASCCMGDIGTHCENLAEYIAGTPISELSADLNTFVRGRKLDDDGSVLLRFKNGARGVLWASQICVGRENELKIRVFCEKGSIEWHQQEPNTLIVDWIDKPRQLIRASTGFEGKSAQGAQRTPAGHPEGYLEGFANIYKSFGAHLEKVLSGKKVKPGEFEYPGVADGVRGMAFLEAVVKSNTSKQRWTKV